MDPDEANTNVPTNKPTSINLPDYVSNAMAKLSEESPEISDQFYSLYTRSKKRVDSVARKMYLVLVAVFVVMVIVLGITTEAFQYNVFFEAMTIITMMFYSPIIIALLIAFILQVIGWKKILVRAELAMYLDSVDLPAAQIARAIVSPKTTAVLSNTAGLILPVVIAITGIVWLIVTGIIVSTVLSGAVACAKSSKCM